MGVFDAHGALWAVTVGVRPQEQRLLLSVLPTWRMSTQRTPAAHRKEGGKGRHSRDLEADLRSTPADRWASCARPPVHGVCMPVVASLPKSGAERAEQCVSANLAEGVGQCLPQLPLSFLPSPCAAECIRRCDGRASPFYRTS